MTHVEPFHDFRHGNATFRYQRHETGIQVWILGADNELLAGFQQVIDVQADAVTLTIRAATWTSPQLEISPQ